MKSKKLLLVVVPVLMTAVALSQTLYAQGEPALVLRVEQKIKSAEPGWRYLRGIQSGRVPIVPSERTLVASVWERGPKRGGRESVSVDIYEVESPAEAERRLSHVARGQVAPGWRVRKYEAGDEAYLIEFQNGLRYTIHLRSKNIVVDVSGSSRSVVERFAAHVTSQIFVN